MGICEVWHLQRLCSSPIHRPAHGQTEARPAPARTKTCHDESNGDDEEDKGGVCGIVLLPANSEREHVQQRHYQPAKRLPRHLCLRVFAAHHSSQAEEPALQKRRRTCAVATQPRQHTCSGRRVCMCVVVCV